MRKILYVSGTRADYGLMRPVLKAIHEHTNLEIEIAATGMHLMEDFGFTINEIEKDNFKLHKIEAVFEKDSRVAMAFFLGEFIQKLTKKVKEIAPDIILVLGDRVEMLGAANVGTYLGIPIAHIHGGEVTETVDEASRHAITKLANIHFPSTKKSAERIIKMGENKEHVFITGAPSLDTIFNTSLLSKEEIFRKYSLDPKEPLIIVLQHPVSFEVDKAAKHMEETMEAIKSTGNQTLVIYPNADAGGRDMIELLEKYTECPFIHIFRNIQSIDFLSLMKYASVMGGNSSCGIIEAPSFKLPVVNIGTRQKGRERANNVIDVDYDKKQIIEAIGKAMSAEFISFLKDCKNPYGDGKTSPRIAKILAEIKINKGLLQKKMAY